VDCSKCPTSRRKSRNCENRGTGMYMERFGSEIFTECPQSYITTLSRWLLQLVQAAEGYHSLPFPTTFSNQPVYFVEACGIVTREKERLRKTEESVNRAMSKKV